MLRLGLIAGNSRVPLVFVEAMRAEGADLVVVAHEGETPLEISTLVSGVTWVRVGELGKIIAAFQSAGITRAVMIGGINKARALNHAQPDERGLTFIRDLPSLTDDVILRGVAQELEKEGISVAEFTHFLPSLIPQEGILTSSAPNEQQWLDIYRGFKVTKDIGRWDIGQTAIIKHRTVLAVEGPEGTDATIRRGGELGGAGTVVVKTSKPQQDLRFDMPVVGPGTIAAMHDAKAIVLAVEARKTLMIEKLTMLRTAESLGISIVALTDVPD